MDDILKLVTLLGAVVALLKGALDILKEYRAAAGAPGSMWARPRFKVAMGLVFLGLFVGVGVALLREGRIEHHLYVKIWNVAFDEKGSLLAAQEFRHVGGSDLPEKTIQEMAAWVIEALDVQEWDEETKKVKVKVHVPADLTQERIVVETLPVVDLEKHLYVFEGEDKFRRKTELTEVNLGDLRRDFVLSFHKYGDIYTMDVVWGKETFREFELMTQPARTRIGIEPFMGEENLIATKLVGFLSDDTRIVIQGPDNLAKLRKEIEEKKRMIREQPWIQEQLRIDLGVDFILSGEYEQK